MDITLIHQRIADAVNGAAIQGNTLQVTATRHMPASPEVPHFYPFNWRATYDKTFGGLVELTTTWHLALSRSDDEAGHQEATDLAGSGESTIRAALLAARGAPGELALSGACDDLRIVDASGPSPVDIESTHLLVVEFSIFCFGD